MSSLESKVKECEQQLLSIQHQLEQYMNKTKETQNDSNSSSSSSTHHNKDESQQNESNENQSDEDHGSDQGNSSSSDKPAYGGEIVQGGDTRTDSKALYVPDRILQMIERTYPTDNDIVTQTTILRLLKETQWRYTEYMFDDNVTKRLMLDQLLPFVCIFYRMNTERLAEFMIGDPLNSPIYVDRKIYAALVERGLLPLAVKLQSVEEAPPHWIKSSTFDFASILRQHICLHAKTNEGRIVYFYNADIVNRDVVSVTQSPKTRNSQLKYLKRSSEDEVKRKRYESAGFARNVQESELEGREKQVLDARKRHIQSKLQERVEQMKNALQTLNPDWRFVPSEETVRKELKRMYKCNGIDVDTGKVHLELNRYLKDKELKKHCTPLRNRTRAAIQGKSTDNRNYPALNYKFRVIPTIRGNNDEKNPWDVLNVIQQYNISQDKNSRSQDTEWMHAKQFVDTIRDIEHDVDKIREQANKRTTL